MEDVVRNYARDVLGMEPRDMDDYLWVADEAMRAPLPQGWEQHEDESRGKPYYVNEGTGETQWTHPGDEFYREKFQRMKRRQPALPPRDRDSRGGRGRSPPWRRSPSPQRRPGQMRRSPSPRRRPGGPAGRDRSPARRGPGGPGGRRSPSPRRVQRRSPSPRRRPGGPARRRSPSPRRRGGPQRSRSPSPRQPARGGLRRDDDSPPVRGGPRRNEDDAVNRGNPVRVRVGGAMPRRRSPSPSPSSPEAPSPYQASSKPLISRPVMRVVKKVPVETTPQQPPITKRPFSVTVGLRSPAPLALVDGVELGSKASTDTESELNALTPKSSVSKPPQSFLTKSPRLSLDSSFDDDDTTVTPRSSRLSRRQSKQGPSPKKPPIVQPIKQVARPTLRIGASAALADALQKEKERADALEADKRSLQARVSALEAEGLSLKSETSGVTNDVRAARQEAARLAGQVAEVQTQKASAERALNESRAEAGGAHARFTEAENALEQLRDQKTQLEVENASLRRRGLDLTDADARHKQSESALREAEADAVQAKHDAHTHQRALKNVEAERDAIRLTLKKSADEAASSRAELEASKHVGAEAKLAGDAALRELERLRDERARRHAKEHDHAMAAGLARSELDAARTRQADASRRALEAESKLVDVQHGHESELRDLKASNERFQRERDVERENAEHALKTVEAARVERCQLEAALRDATAEANALRRQVGIASAPYEHAKLQAERALDRARSDRDAAQAELESLKRVHAANVDAMRAEAEVEMRTVAMASAAEADEDWSQRLAEAVRDVRDRCIRRDREQADEIAALRQALSDVELRGAEQLNRERQALLHARAEADTCRRSSYSQPASVYRDLPPQPPPLAAPGLGELASRLKAMQAAFRAQAYSAPPLSVEPPRQRARAGVSVGVAALVAADRASLRYEAAPPTLERAPGALATAQVADAATFVAPVPEEDALTVTSAFDTGSHTTEGPGFHRGYWQRAYGDAGTELPPPGSVASHA